MMITQRLKTPIETRFRPLVARAVFCAVACFVALAGGCSGPEFRQYEGGTMGTYYRVTARCPQDVSSVIRDELRAVNQEMSTYLADSALSRFNAAPVGSWWDVPRPLAAVVAAARELSRESAGAFDVTVGPLVNLWGFGPRSDPAGASTERSAERRIPDETELDAVRGLVGFEKLDVRMEPPQLRKAADLYVDLSAIAKGHGVDRVAERLADVGCGDLLVDIGGEVRAAGRNPKGRLWRIGVEEPDPERFGAISRVIVLDGLAAATSGDYRNFIEAEGRRYSHTMDPRTGRPVEHALASVTVVHPSAMWADGYATALDVLGPDAGYALAQKLGLAALFIVREDGGFQSRYTSIMEKILID